MTSTITYKRRWKRIRRCVDKKRRDIRVGDLAHRFKLAPSNVSRGLRRRGILLKPSSHAWAALSNPERKERVEKRRKALALYFLDLNREQIEGLISIKSETLRGYILALTIEVRYPGSQPYRLFNDNALKCLAIELEKHYGLGEHVTDFRDAVVAYWPPGHFSADPAVFLRQLRGRGHCSTQFLMRKLRQILKTDVCQHGHFILVRGRRSRLIKLRAPRLDR